MLLYLSLPVYNFYHLKFILFSLNLLLISIIVFGITGSFLLLLWWISVLWPFLISSELYKIMFLHPLLSHYIFSEFLYFFELWLIHLLTLNSYQCTWPGVSSAWWQSISLVITFGLSIIFIVSFSLNNFRVMLCCILFLL